MALIQRDLEITRLYDMIMARESIFLYAPSGMGKTHLLKSLVRKLEGRRICFSLSVRGMISHHQLVAGLEQCVKQTAARYSNVDYQLRRFFEDYSIPEGEELEPITKWIENLLVALQSISQDFLFVIEDLDQWECESPESLFNNFFGSRNSQLILSGAQLEEAFAHSAIPFELLPLQVANFTDPAISSNSETMELLAYTRGNSAFVLDLLQGKNPDEIRLNHNINQVMAIYQPAFYSFRKRFTDLQWRLLKAIAIEDTVAQPHSFEFLMNHKLGAASSVERALKNLDDTSMILRTHEGWQIENVLLQRWMQWLYTKSWKTNKNLQHA